jgi:hypothetical protein
MVWADYIHSIIYSCIMFCKSIDMQRQICSYVYKLWMLVVRTMYGYVANGANPFLGTLCFSHLWIERDGFKSLWNHTKSKLLWKYDLKRISLYCVCDKHECCMAHNSEPLSCESKLITWNVLYNNPTQLALHHAHYITRFFIKKIIH